MDAVPEDIIVIFDEAYYEFLDSPPDTLKYIREGRNVIVMRTFSKIQGLAVATGPGGFTGTRLSVVMARTLAQQLGCPLLGVSAFALMAQRLQCSHQPFWITQVLPRRGVVAGQYSIAGDTVTEIEVPHLLEDGRVVTPARSAELDVEADVACLLTQLQLSLERRDHLPWQGVLPIYPTSPVGPV